LKNYRKLLLIAITFFIGSINAYSSTENIAKEEKKEGGIKSEIKEYIAHHLKDSHSYSITSYIDEESGKKVYIDLPLPVILYDQGLKFFLVFRVQTR
jgi:F-type H+-transporting ATPase subunit a